jgi:hypothetical protein
MHAAYGVIILLHIHTFVLYFIFVSHFTIAQMLVKPWSVGPVLSQSIDRQPNKENICSRRQHLNNNSRSTSSDLTPKAFFPRLDEN